MRRRAFWLAMVLSITMMSAVNAQARVRAVVVNDFANIRVVPAIGADVIATVPAGYIFEFITGRSPDNEWIRVSFNGDEGWVNLAPLTVIEGDINTLPVSDPRTIPYGGFESPRAGVTNATSNITARLDSGLRVRAGPSTGYPVLADAPRNSIVPLLGRTVSNGWIQINFEGTLGWVAAGFLEIQNGASIASLPIDGVVADSLAIARPVAEDFLSTLQLMLARLDLAQPSLDSIRASWTDAALTGRASCQPYPARPSDYNIPNQLLAAYYPTLYPLITLFNDAMFNVRLSIDLFIEACNQPGTGNPVGQATVIGALQTIALADSEFGELRRQLLALIPPPLEPGANECLFTFRNQSDILSVIRIGQLVTDFFSPDKIVTGYCFDAIAGQSLILETLQTGNSNVVHLISVSPFDNPTNFIAVGRGSGGDPHLSVGPVLIPTSGRYLLILSNVASLNEPLNGTFGLLISSITPGSALNSFLTLDPTTGQIVVATPPPAAITPGTPGVPVPGSPPIVITLTPSGASASSPVNNSAACPSTGLSCEQLASCEVAYSCLAAGNFNLDPDADGVPCEISRCPAFP